MGTHHLRVEVGMLDVFHYRIFHRLFDGLVVLEVVATLDFRDQGLLVIAHHAHVAEVTREALLMEGTPLLVTVVVVAVPACFILYRRLLRCPFFLAARQ